jgi:hypothetical protein
MKIVQRKSINAHKDISLITAKKHMSHLSHQRLSHTKKRRPITFTVNAHEKKAQEALF